MKNIIKNRDGALMKIVLLGVALAISLVMISKVYFENSYESFVPNIERAYRITPIYIENGGVTDSHTSIPGGIVGLIKEYSPQVELATRYTLLDEGGISARAEVAFEESRPTSTKSVIAADSLIFDLFPTKLYGDNPKEILSTIGEVMISESLATKMSSNGNPISMIGVSIKSITTNFGTHQVKGIFKDFPANSDLYNTDIIFPVSVMGRGKDGVLGNDRYRGFIKLIDDADISEVERAIERVKNEKIIPKAIEWGVNREGMDIKFKLNPLSEYHSSKDEVKIMTYILITLAFAMLFIAMLNYVLIAVTALVKKAKDIATRRCYGASKWVIYRMLISDALLTLVLSLILASLIIFALQKPVEEIIGVEYNALFGWSLIWIISIISLFIIVVCGVIPAALYSKIPLSAAFSRYKERKARWKNALLTLQFGGTMLFVSLLLIISMQYNFVINLDMGYNYNNLLGVEVNSLTPKEKELLEEEINKVAGVEITSFCSDIPLNGCSGNDVYLPNNKNLFNIRDLYSADENYSKLLELEIVQGRNFSAEAPNGREIMVSDEFITKMETFVDWQGNVIGKEVLFSEHSQAESDKYTICGVFKGFMTGTAYYKDSRPQVLFFNKTERNGYNNYLKVLLIRVKSENPEIIAEIDNILVKLFPNKMLYTQSYTNKVVESYNESRMFRDMVFYASLIVLIITLIGLIGYTNDEISRRRSEIAIRKINGATTKEIIELFLHSIKWQLLFGVVTGGVVTYFASNILLEMFASKIPLSWWIFATSAITITAIITSVVIFTTRKAANANPVENLRD